MLERKQRAIAVLSGALAAVGILCLGDCGSSSSSVADGGVSESLEMRVNAGGPVRGAMVTVYAIADDTGDVMTIVGDNGSIGSGGPTDETGTATVKISVPGWTGPVQVVASGASMSYPDPSVPVPAGGTATAIQIPGAFSLSSFLPELASGMTGPVPVTLLTTLADHEALAYARGLHPLHPGKKRLSEALRDRDGLFVQHMTLLASSWSPGSLRTTIPASVTTGPRTLVDSAYAALFDISLNELAHRTALRAGYPANSTAMNAVSLVQLLEQDLDGDGVINGRDGHGAAIVTAGSTPVTLDSQFLRKPMAEALDEWIQNKSVNLSGVAQADLMSAGVYNAIALDASDLFGSPPDGPFEGLDRAPPELAFVNEPAPCTAATNLTLAVTATDVSGVAKVWCQFGNAAPVAAQQADGKWSCSTSSLTANAPNPISVWAEDGATPSNSGQGLDAPYRLARTVIVDNSAPQPRAVDDLASYRSEAGLTVVVDGGGRAVVPASYNYSQSTPLNVKPSPLGPNVYKVATRIGWTTQPLVSQLEDVNQNSAVGNFPVIQVMVPFSPQTDAPIASATYSVTVGASPPVVGSLWAAARTAADALYFDLPLSSNLFPGLAGIIGATPIAVAVTVTDAVGNSTTTSLGSLTFHVLGPPLAIVEDTSYAGAMDPKSTYPYKLFNGTYATLYDATTGPFGPENSVRLVRYVVTNPSPQPVALAPTFAQGGWNTTETWTASTTSLGSAYYTRTPGNVGPNISGTMVSMPCAYINTYVGSGTLPADVTTATVKEFACAGTATFTPAGGAVQCNTDPGNATISGAQQSAALGTNAYGLNSSGGEGAAVATTPEGRYVVPGASASAPGVLLLYVIRPRAGLSARIPVSGWNGSQFTQNVGQEALVSAGWTNPYGPGYGPCEYYTYSGGFQLTGNSIWKYNVYQYNRALSSAADNIGGTLSLQTFGIAGGTESGEATSVGTMDLTRSVAH